MEETRSDVLATGMKWVDDWQFHVDAGTKVVECCGCGMPVDQTNPRCQILAPADYMGTYGPCCAYMTLKERRRWEKRRERVASGKRLRRSPRSKKR